VVFFIATNRRALRLAWCRCQLSNFHNKIAMVKPKASREATGFAHRSLIYDSAADCRCCCRYYTGLSPVLLPSSCRYVGAMYYPTRPGFLLGFRRDSKFERFFSGELSAASSRLHLTIDLQSIRQLYPEYTFHDLAAHRGVVPLPCQPSMMSLFELYRMNIPLFLPAKVCVEKRFCLSVDFVMAV
jgi:hypothetical protein